jgi:hypothetical protein
MSDNKEFLKEKQEEVINKIINILNLKNKQKYSLYELDHDEKIQNQIIELLPEIQKWFSLNVLVASRRRRLVRLPWTIILNAVLNTTFTIEIKDEKINIMEKKWMIGPVYTFERK